MAVISYLQMSHELEICKNHGCNKQFLSQMRHEKVHFVKTSLSSLVLRREAWITPRLPGSVYSQKCLSPCKHNMFRCHSLLNPGKVIEISGMKNAAVSFTRSFNAFQGSPIVLKLVSAVGIIAFSVWGLGPLMRQSRNIFLNKKDSNWKKSTTYYVTTSYLLPLLLWTGVTLICRVVDPVALPSESSQIVMQRILNFIKSLSTVLALAYSLLSAIQQAQKFFMGTNDSTDPRHMGFEFIFKAVYTAVWVAAVSLFMELLGFSTQKWITAGGLGTLLLTLAGREIFTNFLSSVMIHATRPFILNEWIQTKIEGYDVSGTVERVGWWSPTIIRGEDREAIHIPNHQFTVNVVRNLSHKTHWRIKTHLAISHLDVNKINNIVADMRKVLAKNPQVEPKKLHRRVFLENINPENQALMILVSCFVKTSHLEEYLCVKEAILLDLLRVISHHRARLATPIRTVQKIYSDSGFENIPFSDSLFTRGGATFNRPLLLVEPSSRINGEERAKTQTRPTRTSGEQDSKAATQPAPDGKTDAKAPPQTKAKEKPTFDKVPPQTKAEEKQTFDSKVKEGLRSDTKIDAKAREMRNLDTKEENTDHKVVDKVKAKSKQYSDVPRILPSKQESERLPQPPISRPPLEENIVLGVALEGSKRTLPIEEGPTQAAVKELAKSGSGNASSAAEKDKRDSQLPNAPSTTASNDQRDQQN